MFYPQEVIDEVRAGNEIVDLIGGYVALRPRGALYFGLCPFHNEKSPSFCVTPERQTYKCFGCGAGGNVISFIMQIENYDFPDALQYLADRIRFTLPQSGDAQDWANRRQVQKLLSEIQTKAARFFHSTLKADTDAAQNASRYLDERGVHPRLRIKFGLGLSPNQWDGLYRHMTGLGHTPQDLVNAGLLLPNKNGGYHDRFRERLMFPIFDTGGQVIGFGGRVMGDGEPKYLNSPETPLFNKSRCLYGIHTARKAKHKVVILVEGYMDVLALYQAGYPNVAGVLGTALTAEHARLLRRINCDTVILLLDSDAAGTKAALRAIPVLLSGGLAVKVLQVTDAKDPDEFIRRYGSERFGQMLQTAQGHIMFQVNTLRQQYDLSDTEQRIAFTTETAAVVATLDSAIEADAYIKEIAAMTGIAANAIHAEVNKRKAAPMTTPRENLSLRYSLAGQSNEKGLREARKALIALLFRYPQISRIFAREAYLTPDEMGGGMCGRLLSMAYENGQTGKPLEPANVIARFETLEEQKEADELLGQVMRFEHSAGMEKALNEMVKVVKRAHIAQRMTTETDQNAVNTLFEAKRNLDSLYITMTDG